MQILNKLREYFWLIFLFFIVILMSVLLTYSFGYDFMGWMGSFMGSFFLVFSSVKLPNIKHFKETYSKYDLIAMKFSWYGYVYPFIELILGILYIFGFYLLFTNVFTLILMLVSSFGVYLKISRGEKILCGCLGTISKLPISWITLTENLLMAGMATVMLVYLL